ncbi:hypothetical protein O7634_21185 [Micromonospora sp. WMMD1120]|uniref:hypothetical protein n=1 Tax=Micromonospora sp. WMMD1120 TaxID=3016106 RepID=UPI00241686D3|nr:hypothetical protein [Micromonospora sp. WMMD1120]MDG4809271.1 hypothetical protein [Micromonospora sp. WMMD1120]
MIEAIVSGVLVKIAEGSGAALVDLIRRRFLRQAEPGTAIESLDRAARGDASPDDLTILSALLRRCLAEDPEFLRELRQQIPSTGGATNVVATSTVGKLVQAQRVGDITM